MRTLLTLPLAAALWLTALTGCQKERSGSILDNKPGSHSDQTITVLFSPSTINIAQVDSVVVDLITPNAADYRHLTLQKMGERFATTNTVPVMGYDAYVIIYLRSENSNSYAFLNHQVYGGGKEFIHIAAPKAMADGENWQLMGRTFDRENEFNALVGVSPSNPLLYLFTNAQKRNYIYIDKSYTQNGQHVGSGTFEYVAETTLPHPLIFNNAFASTTASMEGKSWTALSSMTLAMNQQNGQENLFYFEHIQ